MKYLILLSSVLISVSSCSKDRLKGEGATVSETRITTSFTEVDMNGSAEVRVYWDSVSHVVITGYQNLIPAYTSAVSGKRLILEFDPRYRVTRSNIRVDVYTPDLHKLSLNGSGNVRVHGDFHGDFSAEINGSGNFFIERGEFPKAYYSVNGSGNIFAKDAVADTATARISGSGNIELTVKDYLSARISGSGDIDYWGNPMTDINVSGSGNVKRK